MSLLFFDSFGNASAAVHDPEGGDDDLSAQWQNFNDVTVVELEAGAFGRRCYVTGAVDSFLEPNMAWMVDGFTLGFRFYIDSLAADRCVLRITDHAGLPIGHISFDATDDSLAYTTLSTASPTTAVSRATAPLSVGWNYVEVRVKAGNGTAGEVHWQINGSAAGSDTGIDTMQTGSADATKLRVLFMTNSSTQWNVLDRLADVYLSEFADAFIGITEVWYQAADAAGASADFTPSAGSNHENVDDIGHDGDTTYNSSAVAADRDSFTHTDVATGAPRAVQAMGLVRAEAGFQDVRLGVNSAGSIVLSSLEGLMGDANFVGVKGTIQETDPDTAVLWTAAGIDAAETLIELGP